MDPRSPSAPLPPLLDSYAELLAAHAAPARSGGDVHLHASVEHGPFVRRLVAHLYRAGTRFVDVLYADPHVDAALAEHGRHDAALEWSPPWLLERLERMADEGGVAL
nr:aminopeptidase [Actinomycetota bacterium]